MNLFFQPLITDGARYLDEEESRHCVKVLRKHAGDAIQITDGKGFYYEAVITKADLRKCDFEIIKTTPETHRDFSVHIAVSPTKNSDRIEWFVEKATEFGVDRISLIDCEHTERTFIKTDRLKKIAASAMKQSLKARVPEIDELQKFETLIANANEENRCIAYVDHSNPITLQRAIEMKKSTLVLIGPEGDFSAGEIELALQHNFTKVSLGPSRLRTETAAIAACHIINLVNAESSK